MIPLHEVINILILFFSAVYNILILGIKHTVNKEYIVCLHF